ncbi:MAG: hypothetical protein COT85_03310 [Chlamydiae bacterium CG10_big_fil_rev_8_21_14_0_10_42_34]|nr:MAG: hypothetical protein COT85_03310 [Chlamydiae bacterium CG10_big_fil_rev_8_21_14_0_10_42_34]
MQETRLSPFHSEILEYLLSDVKKRCSEEGFDPSTDLKLQQLIEELSPSFSDTPLPLAEIVDNYQHVFGARGPLHMEKFLMEAFPVNDFANLDYRTFPRMYRGLPRLYHRDSPLQSYVKKNFAHLPSLKKCTARKALCSLYAKVPVDGVVTLLSYLKFDDEGVSSADVLQMLKARLPAVQFETVTLPSVNSPVSSLSEQQLHQLRTSDLILQIPLSYAHTDELMEVLQTLPLDHPLPKMEIVGGYGLIESSQFHPKSENHCLGLHFLEKGVLTRRKCSASWDDLKNEKLRALRCPENSFYLAYLTTPIGGAIYLHSLLKSLENDPRGIDVCISDVSWFLELAAKQQKGGRSLIEWELGIESIELYYDDRAYSISIAPQGKKLRLICPGPISRSDYRVLLSLSEDWVAVRGDWSFSEAVSQDKPFFFDGGEPSRYFVKDLAAIAENRIDAYESTLTCIRGNSLSFLYTIPVQESHWVDETFFQDYEEWPSIALSIGLSLQEPDTFLGYKALNKVIREEFSANGFLCHLVQRALCHAKNPQVEQIESQQLEQFATNKSSFSELIEVIKNTLTFDS